ncbi:MAG: hypothetical protein R3E99_02450 [Burkholderiaceae bacterium]
MGDDDQALTATDVTKEEDRALPGLFRSAGIVLMLQFPIARAIKRLTSVT